MSSDGDLKGWHFVTSHTQVLLCIARDPEMRMKDIADTVGITERAAQRIVADLIEAGYLQRERMGRRNRYAIDETRVMRHPEQRTHEVGELLALLRHGPEDSAVST